MRPDEAGTPLLRDSRLVLLPRSTRCSTRAQPPTAESHRVCGTLHVQRLFCGPAAAEAATAIAKTLARLETIESEVSALNARLPSGAII